MIPELVPEDYEESDHIPEELLVILLAAIPAFEKARQDILLRAATKNYLQGIRTAYEKLGKSFKPSEVEDDVYSFVDTYQKQIKEGYTVIQSEKVYWLKDRTQSERKYLFDTISTGITKGQSPDVVRRGLQDYFEMSKRHAEVIARTETAYVQGRGTEDRYKKQGVERVKWLLGPNPCPECQGYGGRIYTWEELPKEIPAHPSCTCAIVPVLDPNEKETPYIPTTEEPTTIDEHPTEPVKTPKTTPEKPEETKKEPVKTTPAEKPKIEPKKELPKERETPKEKVKEVKKTEPKPDIEKTIRNYEKEIKTRSTEKAYIFDKEGKVLLEKEGTEKAVNFTIDEMKLMKSNISTHNHPKSTSFSSADISLACKLNMNEMRATGKQGTYIMKMADGSDLNKDIWNKKISKEYKKQYDDLILDMRTKILNKEITRDDALVDMSHEIWTKVATKIPEIDYKFIKEVVE